MPTSPYNRLKIRDRKDTDETVSGGLARLLSIGPYDRNQITSEQIDRIREMIDTLGEPIAAERLGVSAHTMLKVTSGFGHRLRPETAAKIRKFLGGRK